MPHLPIQSAPVRRNTATQRSLIRDAVRADFRATQWMLSDGSISQQGLVGNIGSAIEGFWTLYWELEA